MIQLGAVVALQDIHQHMYFAVEDLENDYRLTGVIHYSLAKERALFRVYIAPPFFELIIS